MKNKLVLMLIILVIIPFVIAANKINLQSREISPEDKLTAARYRVENVAKTDLKKDTKNYYIVQFDHILDDNEKQELEKKGIKIIRYVPEYAWLVSLRSDKYTLLSNYQGLTYIGEYTKEDRMLHSLNTREKTNNFFQKKDNIVKIQGYFFEDNSYEDINSVLSSYNINYTLDGSYFVINVSIKDISSLAGEQGIDWLTDFFPEKTVYNNNARALHGVNIVEALPYNLSGLGIVAAEWDGGWAGNHSDLNGRVTIGDSGCVEAECLLDSHAIHVAGTMLGNGSINSSLKGMAPKATLISYEWFDGLSEFNTEYSQAISTYNATVSQNSWGYSTSPINTANCKALLGNYYTESIWIDNATRGSQGKKITIVWSAGNDRSTNSVYCGSLGFTYNTTTPMGTSKNTITVGAVDDSLGMTSFSSWGPTDDGRLKPDIVANGLGVTSTILANGYSSYDGTSMAAPGVSGVILLLQELYKRHRGTEMDPAIVKNLLIHTAKDLGNTGPDFQNGYGLVNATKGAEYILNDINQTLIFLNNVTSTGTNQTYYFELASGNPEFKVSIVWNDYPGSPTISKQLLNDLDLIVTNASGNRFYPWTLNTSNHAASAIQTVDDHLNNVEQVYIQNPSSGIWTIIINGSTIPYTNQEFSLITSISDELSPRVAIASPSNQTSYTRSLVDLNYTVIDMNLDKCWFTNSSGQNQTIASCANQTLTLTDGNHTITFYANDTFGNLVRDEKVFNVTAALPQITFISSVVNGTNITNNFLFVNITTSEIVINATIEADSVNYTMSGSNQNFYYNITGLGLGNHNFSVNVKDIDGNSNNSGLINYVVVASIPTITLTYPSANQIVNSYTVELNYTLNETNRDRVWYTKNLNSTKIFLNPTQNTGINLQNITFGRTGKQKISVFVNNTLAGINSSNMTFFINQSQNMTEWSQRLSTSSANLSTVQILASNNTVLTQNTTLAQQLSIELNFTNITVFAYNFSGLNATWDLGFKAEDNSSEFVAEVVSALIINPVDYVRIRNFTNFINETNDYYGSVKLPKNFSSYDGVYYCSEDNVSSCGLIGACTGTYTKTTTTACYNTTSNYTLVYVPHYSSVFGADDTAAPVINITSPSNNSIINKSYQINLNFTTNENSTCSYTLNSTTANVSGTTIFGTIFNFYSNTNKNITVNCTDLYSNSAFSRINITLNDTTGPVITRSDDSNTSSVTLDVSTNEPSNFSVFLTNGATFTNASYLLNHTIIFNGLSEDTLYNYNITACDQLLYCTNSTSSERTDSASSSSSSSASSSSSSSSSAGGSSAAQSATAKKTQVWDRLDHGDNVLYIANTKISFTKLTLAILKDIESSVTLSIESLESLPSSIDEITGMIFQYLETTEVGLTDNDIGNVMINFRVDNAWIEANSIDQNSIKLYRYTSSWNELSTEFISDDATYSYYASESPGLSYYAIKGTSIGAATANETIIEENIIATTPEIIIKEQKKPNYAPLILLIIIIVIVLGLYAYKKFNPGNKGNKEERIVQTNKQSASNTQDSLMNYILQSINSGQSREQVKESLLKAGWDEQTIDNYLRRL